MHLKDELNPLVARRTWVVQRVAWLLMLGVLVLAVAGVLGTGVLSRDTVRAGTDRLELRIDYERWARARSPQQVDITVSATAPGDEIALTISREFADAIAIESVVPEPDRTSFAADGVRYAWRVDEWTGEATVSIEYQARTWGRLSADVTASAGGEEQHAGFTQFVYP